jgi:hypothetical protein
MKTSIKITLFVVFFIAVSGIGISLYLYNKKPANMQTTKADYLIMANDLARAFENDAVGASNKYVNKVIEVTGIIQYAGSVNDGVMTIALKGTGLSNVICTFQNIPDIMQTDTGVMITLRGVCSGYLLDVLLNDCILIKK